MATGHSPPSELTDGPVLILVSERQHLLGAVCVLLLLGELLEDLAAGQGRGNAVLALGPRGNHSEDLHVRPGNPHTAKG